MKDSMCLYSRGTRLVVTSAGFVVGAIIVVVFFTRTEVTIATLRDSFAILDVSELRISACL